MMIIAVIIGALLMPAQVSAQSRGEKRGNGRVQVDSKRGGSDKKKHDKSFGKNDKRGNVIGKKDNKPGSKNIHIGKGGNKPGKHGHNHGHVHKPKVIVNHCHHNHGHRPIVHHHNCNDDIVGAAAAVIGTVALISLLAD